MGCTNCSTSYAPPFNCHHHVCVYPVTVLVWTCRVGVSWQRTVLDTTNTRMLESTQEYTGMNATKDLHAGKHACKFSPGCCCLVLTGTLREKIWYLKKMNSNLSLQQSHTSQISTSNLIPVWSVTLSLLWAHKRTYNSVKYNVIYFCSHVKTDLHWLKVTQPVEKEDL